MAEALREASGAPQSHGWCSLVLSRWLKGLNAGRIVADQLDQAAGALGHQVDGGFQGGVWAGFAQVGGLMTRSPLLLPWVMACGCENGLMVPEGLRAFLDRLASCSQELASAANLGLQGLIAGR